MIRLLHRPDTEIAGTGPGPLIARNSLYLHTLPPSDTLGINYKKEDKKFFISFPSQQQFDLEAVWPLSENTPMFKAQDSSGEVGQLSVIDSWSATANNDYISSNGSRMGSGWSPLTTTTRSCSRGSIETTAGHGGAVVSGNRSFVWRMAAARRWQDTRISEEVF